MLDETTISEFLLPEERNNIDPADAVALWTAKEAVSKALGLGFNLKEFVKIRIPEFGYNEPYPAFIQGEEQPVHVVTFKDSSRVASIAWRE